MSPKETAWIQETGRKMSVNRFKSSNPGRPEDVKTVGYDI